jgi:hypothetical protein
MAAAIERLGRRGNARRRGEIWVVVQRLLFQLHDLRKKIERTDFFRGRASLGLIQAHKRWWHFLTSGRFLARRLPSLRPEHGRSQADFPIHRTFQLLNEFDKKIQSSREKTII